LVKKNLIGYIGDLDPIGTVTLRFNPDNSFLLLMDMNGLDENCASGSKNCAVRIVSGSCDGTPFTSEDSFDNTTAFYNAQSGGISGSAFVFNNGANLDDNLGKYVVLEDTDENIIGCGELIINSGKKVLDASFGKYPGSDAPIDPSGRVAISFEDDNSFLVSYSLFGMEPNCVDCGFHIHAGFSCATNELVLGHEWNTAQTQDLWFPQFGALYNSNEEGRAHGSFRSYNGFGVLGNLNHAIVLHGVGGKRVGCGVLKEASRFMD